MTLLEKSELAVIPLCTAGAWVLAPAFMPDRIDSGRLLCLASALLLFQSLIRDLLLLATAKRAPAPPTRLVARCMCVESTIGVTGLVVGAVLLGVAIRRPVAMAPWGWSLLLFVVLAAGYGMKDMVFEWNPWRIRQDKDHLNIVFTWKK